MSHHADEYWPESLAKTGYTEADLQTLVERWFSRFAVRDKRAKPPHTRPIAELRAAVEDLQLGDRGFANLIVFPRPA